MKVEQIMSQPAITCGLDAPSNEAARLMWEHDVGAVPVVDGEGHVAGMVTDRDLCMAAYTQGCPLREIPVATVMARDVISCGPQDSVQSAEQAMSQRQIRRLPVVDPDGRPIGVLSLNDVARVAGEAPKRNGLDRRVMETLAAICQPRRRPPQATRPKRRASAASAS